MANDKSLHLGVLLAPTKHQRPLFPTHRVSTSFMSLAIEWQPISLECLFAKTAEESLRTRRGERMVQHAQEEEQMHMQFMAESDAADNTPDNGEVEINDSEVYGE
ncbi:hypothetical protein C8R45DRAFT_932383 [Mycena sanguinolenta]|nr:hypothetical protein C8R45DRAFT_932383 [Mycena sanguinolenta]